MGRFMPDTWPLPAIDRFNRGFFTSGKLILQECVNCGQVQHPPDDVCFNCQGMEFRGRETNGRGTIYSYIVVHNPPAPSLVDKVPYGVVLVSLEEYPEIRIIGNVLNRQASDLAIGQKVRVVFEEIDDPQTGERIFLPQWEVV